MDCARVGIDQLRIRPGCEPELPEPLISGDLSIVANKSAEALHGDSSLGLLDYAKAGIDQFRIRPEYEPESLESLIAGDLGIVATKSAETLQRGSLLESLGLCKSWDRSVSYATRIRTRIAGTTDKRRYRYYRN